MYKYPNPNGIWIIIHYTPTRLNFDTINNKDGGHVTNLAINFEFSSISPLPLRNVPTLIPYNLANGLGFDSD